MRFFVPFRGIDGHTQRDGLGPPPVRETERQRRPAVAIDGVFATYDFDIHAIRCYANGSLHSVKRVKHRPENPCSVIALRRSVQFLSPRQSSVQMRQLTGYQNKKAVISDCLRERKTRLEPTLRVGRSRRYSSPPLPLEGALGSLAEVSVFLQTKKTAEKAVFSERKTRLELATPTLARLCSTN